MHKAGRGGGCHAYIYNKKKKKKGKANNATVTPYSNSPFPRGTGHALSYPSPAIKIGQEKTQQQQGRRGTKTLRKKQNRCR